MPTYTYQCSACDKSHEEFRSITKPHPKKCPSCGEAYGKGFTQDYSQSCGIPLVYGNPTTVGQQAEINARRAGKEQLQLMKEARAKQKPAFTGKLPKGAKINRGTGETPWWRSGEVAGLPKSEPLNIDKIHDKTRYIETGHG